MLLAALLGIGSAPARGQEQNAQGGGEGGAKTPAPPQIPAAAWLLVDARDGSELAGSKQTRTLPIASTTKLMTAYVVLEELDLDEKITAPGYDALPAESVLGLQEGEKLSVRDLLTAMMLPSANDAAYALAEGAAGSVPAFVDRMNEEAARLGLDDTSYTTPIGLDDPGNGSSARDLATLAGELMKDKRFREIVSQTQATLETGAMPRTVTTRNTLMFSDPSVNGIKTGHTLGAGYVLVASAERGGIPLISVVLGAAGEAERDSASEQLLDFGFSLYQPRVAVKRGGARVCAGHRGRPREPGALSRALLPGHGPRRPAARDRARRAAGRRGTDRSGRASRQRRRAARRRARRLGPGRRGGRDLGAELDRPGWRATGCPSDRRGFYPPDHRSGDRSPQVRSASAGACGA